MSWPSVVGLLINNSIKDNLLRDDLLKGNHQKIVLLNSFCHLKVSTVNNQLTE